MANGLKNQQALARRIIGAAGEIVSFDELAHELLPLLQRILAVPTSYVFRCTPEWPLVLVGGLGWWGELIPTYVTEHMADDPMQAVARRLNLPLFHGTRYPEWETYVRRPVHAFLARHDVEDVLHLRLFDGPHLAPGMAGILLARSPRQPCFDEQDEVLAAQLLPALQTAARRCRRTLEAARERRILEHLLEDGDALPRLSVDLDGRVVWMSSRAERLLGGARKLPAPLHQAVREIAGHVQQPGRSESPRRLVDLQDAEGARLRGDLRLIRDANGDEFVVVELRAEGSPPSLADTARRFGLTRAETHVLGHLASGLRDSEIAARTFTSIHTVRTHVSRILGKLGARSRVEAALIARGPGSQVGVA